MTTSTPPVSDVLRGIEDLAAQSLRHLAEALDLITKASKAEAIAVETAVAVLGEERGRTALELAKISVSGQTVETLQAISSLVSGMLSETGVAPGNGKVPPAVPVAHRAAPQVIADSSGRVEMFGILVPAARIAEADDVVATARTAVAQNRKANPYDHYRGKNSWVKSLFLAAFSQITSDAAASSVPTADEIEPTPSPAAAPPPSRQSVMASGPVRGVRQGLGDPPPRDHPVARIEPTVPQHRTPQPAQRLHAHGTTAQTIPEEVLQQSATPRPAPQGRQSFFRKR